MYFFFLFSFKRVAQSGKRSATENVSKKKKNLIKTKTTMYNTQTFNEKERWGKNSLRVLNTHFWKRWKNFLKFFS